MFTGIVEERGEVVDLHVLPAQPGGQQISRLAVRGPIVTSDARPGDSIAVNGCCLTVVEADAEAGVFSVDVIQETLRRTSLGKVEPGAAVNLERSVRPDSRLSGHLVQGHVDGTGMLLDSRGGGDSGRGGAGRDGDEVVLWIGVPSELARYVAAKGSIAVEGVSLTVVEVRDRPDPAFSVALIPTTLDLTTLGQVGPGDAVNLEVDVIAKYVERLLGPQPGNQPGNEYRQETKA